MNFVTTYYYFFFLIYIVKKFSHAENLLKMHHRFLEHGKCFIKVYTQIK